MIEKTASFEDKLQELEKIVSELEAGNVPLEDMIVLYEKGQKIYTECNEILTSFEKRLAGVDKVD